MSRARAIITGLALAFLLAPLPLLAQSKDQSQMQQTDPGAGADAGGAAESPDTGESAGNPAEFAMADLTVESARNAFDAYSEIQQKFSDAAFEDYDSLEDFVKRAPQGKDFEAVIKAHGFADVSHWLPVINAVEFTITAIVDDQKSTIDQQIAEVSADASIAEDEKQKIIKSLNDSLPSENNQQVIGELMKDPAYAEKFKAYTNEE